MSAGGTMVEYYAQRALELERVYEKPERQGELRELKEIVHAFADARDVLEVACGTGYWTAVAAARARHVTAFDINESMLALARGKPIDPRRVSFGVADAYRLPVSGRRFTAGLAAFWWSHVPRERLREFLEPFHAALAPGARVLFLDNTLMAGESTPITRRDSVGNTYQQRSLESGAQFEVLKNHPTDEELRHVLSAWAHGPVVRCLRYYWVLSYTTR